MHWKTRTRKVFGFGISLAVLFLGFGGAPAARAGVVYDFSLAANGTAGAFDIQLFFPNPVTPAGLQVYSLSDPSVVLSYSYTGSALNLANSVIGFEVTPTATLFGLSLNETTSTVALFTVNIRPISLRLDALPSV